MIDSVNHYRRLRYNPNIGIKDHHKAENNVLPHDFSLKITQPQHLRALQQQENNTADQLPPEKGKDKAKLKLKGSEVRLSMCEYSPLLINPDLKQPSILFSSGNVITTEIGIGNPPQIFHVQLDLSSSASWVASSTCDDSCWEHDHKYNIQKQYYNETISLTYEVPEYYSETLKNENHFDFEIFYDTGLKVC